VTNIVHAIDSDGEIWQEFGIASQPAWAFVNDDGKIETNIGALGKDRLLEEVARLESI